jgi:transposase InsO family protein
VGVWVTDITEHPTREGKLYCAVVLGTFSRRVVGWSIDSSPTAALVTNALGMAIQNRTPPAGEISTPIRECSSLLGRSPSAPELRPGALNGLGRGLL